MERLILIKNSSNHKYEDKTDDILSIKQDNHFTLITYKKSAKEYKYDSSKIRILNSPQRLNPEGIILSVNDYPLNNIAQIKDYGEYVQVIFNNGSKSLYSRRQLSIQKTVLNNDDAKSILEYLKALSRFTNSSDEGESYLFNQYERMKFVSNESVLGSYITKNLTHDDVTDETNKQIPIFPFGINLSQRKAVEAAFSHQMSIIEGPPGTGKTQTILNIIANAIYMNKTIAVVSGNNSATDNVIEKLEKNGYDFIAALLGNQKKKEAFFKMPVKTSPELKKWKCHDEVREKLKQRMQSISNELTQLLSAQNELAKLKEELSKLETEQHYFDENVSDAMVSLKSISIKRKWKSNELLKFIIEYKALLATDKLNHVFNKAKLFFQFGIYSHKTLNERANSMICSINDAYYKSAIEERTIAIASLEGKLVSSDFNALMKEYADISNDLFKDSLSRRYEKKEQKVYSVDSFRKEFNHFINDYPVILSTTHAIKSCIREHYLFDYLVIDEASQVDLVSAALALSCSRNLIVVGDAKQLPQIVPNPVKLNSDCLMKEKQISSEYDYTNHSILTSVQTLFGETLSNTLLSEHYRCHPKIIRFCNEKYYNNQLIVMTNENPDDDALKIIRTVPGNHARKAEKGWVNQREIDVVRNEVINNNIERYGDCSEVGLISPYRAHVDELIETMPLPKLEADTVHKFQGREKSTIIFSTVVNDINSFVDDPNLINVAVSRAVDEMIVVTTNKSFHQHGSHLGDLIRYMEYNSLEKSVIESKIVSVFDMLYSEYSATLRKFIERTPKVSEHISENLLYVIIENILEKPEFKSFKCVLHVPMSLLVKSVVDLNEREKSFVMHPCSHVDFLIFNKLDKEPVLAVEVDGFRGHQCPVQRERDLVKDRVLDKIGLPLLRLKTNGSEETLALSNKLLDIVNQSNW